MVEKTKRVNREKFNELVKTELLKSPFFNLNNLNACFEYSYIKNNTIIKLICTE